MCDHPLTMLVGEKEGIRCKVCGMLFPSFDEIRGANKPDLEQKPEQEPQEKKQSKPRRAAKAKGVK